MNYVEGALLAVLVVSGGAVMFRLRLHQSPEKMAFQERRRYAEWLNSFLPDYLLDPDYLDRRLEPDDIDCPMVHFLATEPYSEEYYGQPAKTGGVVSLSSFFTLWESERYMAMPVCWIVECQHGDHKLYYLFALRERGAQQSEWVMRPTIGAVGHSRAGALQMFGYIGLRNADGQVMTIEGEDTFDTIHNALSYVYGQMSRQS